MKRFYKFLESGGKRAEFFKIFVNLLVFGGVLHFTLNSGPEVFAAIVEAPSNFMAKRERNLRDLRNKEVVERAEAELLDARVRACNVISKSRGDLLRCLKGESK